MQPSSVRAGPCGKPWATSRSGAGPKDGATPCALSCRCRWPLCWPAATTCARSSAGDAGCRPRRRSCSASSGGPAPPRNTTSSKPLLLQGPRRGRDRTGVGRLGARVLLGAWAQGSRPLGTVAIDGKRLRGSAPAGHAGIEGGHVVAAFASQLGPVICQVQVASEADEITVALALLKSLPLAGAIITGDAAFCQRAVCQGVRDRKGDYLFTVKANQPQLMADIALAFGDAFPPGADQGSGRAGPL